MTTYTVGKDRPFYDGPHKMPTLNRLSLVQPTDMRGIASLFQKVFRILHKLLNDTPDYDSGYFRINSGGNDYMMDHGFGVVPRRATLYYSSTKPERDKDYVQHFAGYTITGSTVGGSGVVGLTLYHRCDGLDSYVRTRATALWSTDTEAWVRVLLWK